MLLLGSPDSAVQDHSVHIHFLRTPSSVCCADIMMSCFLCVIEIALFVI